MGFRTPYKPEVDKRFHTLAGQKAEASTACLPSTKLAELSQESPLAVCHCFSYQPLQRNTLIRMSRKSRASVLSFNDRTGACLSIRRG